MQADDGIRDCEVTNGFFECEQNAASNPCNDTLLSELQETTELFFGGMSLPAIDNISQPEEAQRRRIRGMESDGML